MVRQHQDSAKYRNLPPASKTLLDLALGQILQRWGQFEAAAIRPVHVQATYDSLADQPATANQRLDGVSATFGWGEPRGLVDVNPCSRIERVESVGSYEPWPEAGQQTLIENRKREIVKVAPVATYTGQRRGNVLQRLSDPTIDGSTWYLEQARPRTSCRFPFIQSS